MKKGKLIEVWLKMIAEECLKFWTFNNLKRLDQKKGSSFRYKGKDEELCQNHKHQFKYGTI